MPSVAVRKLIRTRFRLDNSVRGFLVAAGMHARALGLADLKKVSNNSKTNQPPGDAVWMPCGSKLAGGGVGRGPRPALVTD